jgi:hypothetical protein
MRPDSLIVGLCAIAAALTCVAFSPAPSGSRAYPRASNLLLLQRIRANQYSLVPSSANVDNARAGQQKEILTTLRSYDSPASELWDFGNWIKLQAVTQKKTGTPSAAKLDRHTVAKTLHQQIVALTRADLKASPARLFQALSNACWAVGSMHVTMELVNDVEAKSSSRQRWFDIVSDIVSAVAAQDHVDEVLNLDDLFRLVSGLQKMGATFSTMPEPLQVLV